MEILQTIWFALTGVLLAAFLVTGGCDFGAGINILFLRDAKSRIYAAEKILPFDRAERQVQQQGGDGQ